MSRWIDADELIKAIDADYEADLQKPDCNNYMVTLLSGIRDQRIKMIEAQCEKHFKLNKNGPEYGYAIIRVPAAENITAPSSMANKLISKLERGCEIVSAVAMPYTDKDDPYGSYTEYVLRREITE